MRRSVWMLLFFVAAGCDRGVLRHVIMPEQRTISYDDRSSLPKRGNGTDGVEPTKDPLLPTASAEPAKAISPRTVSTTRKVEEWNLSLDDAIRIGLENARAVRVLTGVSATASGRTIYDPAIANTTIDQEQARFDPTLSHKATWNGSGMPAAFINPLNPNESLVLGSREHNFLGVTGLNKTNVMGGQAAANWVENPTRFLGASNFFGVPRPFPLNPENRNSLELSYTQPLLQGAGVRFNTAPIVIARLNTEVSFFQYKDSVQELVRGVIEAYWNLVLARTDVWAKKIQVEQSKEAYDLEKARLEAKLADKKNEAQAHVTYTQFKAALVAAEAAVLAREGALRNLLGLTATDERQIIPVSAPVNARIKPDWTELVRLSEERRPDLIELRLILEAEQVRLLQAENQTLPRVDAVALYRWNGLAGAMPNGERLATGPGQYTDWTAGVNFSVPLGLRQGRAKVREAKLLILRDRANLDQGLHAALHDLAITIRNLDSNYEQFKAYQESRLAAYENVKVQVEENRAGRSIYLRVLQALNDWGSAVTSEARALLDYNITLATLERQTGTILETHGLVFYEERFRAAGPLGIFGKGREYPSALPVAGSPDKYPATKEPSENSFDLKNPAPRETKPNKQLPPPPKVEAPPMPRLIAPAPTPAVTLPLTVGRRTRE